MQEPNLALCRQHNRQTGHPNRQLPPLSPIKLPLHLVFSLKRCLALMPWLLLPYATTTQALSATTAQVIHGTQPYLTFDNGVTKATTTDALLGITLSDGTTYTPATNTSATTPVVLPNVGETLADVQMSVPPTADSIALSTLIGAPYNYWGDDDGDGQGDNGIAITGNLSVSITDSNYQTVSRNAILDVCNAPYKVELTSSAGSLTTQYGIPNSRNFDASNVTYYISPKSNTVKVCYAQPGGGLYTDSLWGGPSNIWNEDKGGYFLIQSTDPSTYGRNFPTTGANKLYFYLRLSSSVPLTWPSVTKSGITATVTTKVTSPPNYLYRVLLTGPVATKEQQSSSLPGSISKPNLPQTFELVGYDSSNRAVVKYGFVLKQWFIGRNGNQCNYTDCTAWCSSIGYRIPQVKELTNARCSTCRGQYQSDPLLLSRNSDFNRNIGAGFFAEWGSIDSTYTETKDEVDFINGDYWTSEKYNTLGSESQAVVYSNYGNISNSVLTRQNMESCVYP